MLEKMNRFFRWRMTEGCFVLFWVSFLVFLRIAFVVFSVRWTFDRFLLHIGAFCTFNLGNAQSFATLMGSHLLCPDDVSVVLLNL